MHTEGEPRMDSDAAFEWTSEQLQQRARARWAERCGPTIEEMRLQQHRTEVATQAARVAHEKRIDRTRHHVHNWLQYAHVHGIHQHDSMHEMVMSSLQNDVRAEDARYAAVTAAHQRESEQYQAACAPLINQFDWIKHTDVGLEQPFAPEVDEFAEDQEFARKHWNRPLMDIGDTSHW